jgi:cytochrome c oxidase cbb3-type subunit 3
MLAWERQLRPAEILAVTAYVGTLLGSDPPNAKAPQGELAERLPPAEVSDAGEAAADEGPSDAAPAAS